MASLAGHPAPAVSTRPRPDRELGAVALSEAFVRDGLPRLVLVGDCDRHERGDGKGAPGGVAGEDVSLAQRVVTVAHDAVVLTRLGEAGGA